MCSICDRYGNTANPWFGPIGQVATHFVDSKYSTAFPADIIGTPHGPEPVPITLITIDTGDDMIAPTNPVLTVDGNHVIGTIDAPGDADFYQVQLVEGQTYQIGMYSYNLGPNLVGLADPFIEVYDSSGNLIVVGDGGAQTLRNDINSGFDVLLSYTADYTGTFYINARAFDQVADANNEGESVGDFEIFVQTPVPDAYVPYYDPDSPLYAIDWGTQVNRINQSQRNPDGNEGPRNTGNPIAVDPVSGEAFGHPGKNVITIYFARAGDVFTSIEDPTNPGAPPVLISSGTQDWEKDVVWTALGEFERVADVVYVEVDTREEADFFFTTYAGTPGPGVSLLGSMSPPDYPDEGLAQFNSGDYRWTEQNLQQGGFSYVTLIHEFGHGHGLAHPHDTGGNSGEMRGVSGVINSPAGPIPEPLGVYPNYTLGDFSLNQGVFTMMSYQDGWQTSPYGNAATDVGYGYLGGLMAFDIAAIQDKYGVNEETATGADTYTLKDVNAAGTYYSAIWDAAGIDQIVYDCGRDATIDLRPATLQYEEGGGGFVSFAYGIYGGFTIANGVAIENARGGSGNDTLIGNDSANRLTGGSGNDLLKGLAGIDVLDGGTGTDRLEGGAGGDRYYVDTGDIVIELGTDPDLDAVWARSSYVLTAGSHVETLGTADNRLTIAIDLTGNELNNWVVGNNGVNFLRGGGGDDWLTGYDGVDTLDGGSGTDRLEGGAGGDRYYVDTGDVVVELGTDAGLDAVYARSSFVLAAGSHVETLGTADNRLTIALDLTGNELNNSIVGNEGTNLLKGGGGGDWLNGLGGNDVLDGGAGLDTLIGGAGADIFRFASSSDSARGAADRVTDFAAGTDRIDLSLIDANSGTSGNDAFSFIGAAAFSGVAGQLRAFGSGSSWTVEADVNGDGVADLAIAVTTNAPLTVTEFVL